MDSRGTDERRITPDSIMVPPHLLASDDSATKRPITPEEESGGLPRSVRQSLHALTAIGLGMGDPCEEPSAECCICSRTQMVRPAIGGGCAHHACEACYREWSAKKPCCPVCRAPVWQISVDFEYARLVGCDLGDSSRSTASGSSESSNAECQSEEARPAVESGILHFTIEAPAGITLSSRKGEVVVSALRKGNGADRAGVHVHDQVIAVNGTAVSDHSTACDLIERAGRSAGGDCVLTLRRRPSHIMRRWIRKLLPRPLV